MSPKRIVSLTLVLLVALLAAPGALAQTAAAPAAKPALAHVVILATGGTIAGVQPKEGEPGYKSGSLSIDALIKGAPGIEKLARLDGEQIASIGSQDMNDVVWGKLAKRANELLAQPDVDGIVVTHGTDTLEETGFFLGLVLKSNKPVVLVGSMRPATSQSADGPLNLYNGVAVAADPASQGRGVMVVVNDEVHTGRDVHKTHTTSVSTFVSTTRGTIAKVYYGKVRYGYVPTYKHTVTSEFANAPRSIYPPRVDIVFAHEGLRRDVREGRRRRGRQGDRPRGRRRRERDDRHDQRALRGREDRHRRRPSVARRLRHGAPQRRARRRQARVRRRDGPQPAEGARPPARRAHADERRREDPEVLRGVLTLEGGDTA